MSFGRNHPNRLEQAARHLRGRPSLPAGALVLLVLCSIVFSGCAVVADRTNQRPTGQPATAAVTKPEGKITDLVLATTTSTQDSGLLDELIPAFEKAHPQYRVKVLAVGSGEALKLGERKDADVLLVHCPAAEKEFVDSGYGLERRDVMYNEFVIVGPESDPARIAGLHSALEAFDRIARTGSSFYSRNDQSGTNIKELEIWQIAGRKPAGPWYHTTGQGMGETLRIASEKQAYTITDLGTFLSMRDRLALQLHVQGDPRLRNQYGVIPVAEAKNTQGARDFTIWITSPEAQALIRQYGVAAYGQPLFVPNAH